MFGALLFVGLFLLTRIYVPESNIDGMAIISYVDTSIPDKVIDTTNGHISLAIAQPGTGNAISNVRFVVKATPSWEGVPTSISAVTWTVGGLVKLDGVNKQTITGSGPSTISSGQAYTVSTHDISGAVLDTWIPSDYKTHTLSIVVDVYCNFLPPASEAKEISGQVSGNIALEDIGFPAVLSVTLDKTVS